MRQELRNLGIDVKEHHRGNIKVPCPKCSPTRKHKNDPCLSVNVDDGIWNCHHCGYQGGIKKYEKKEYVKPLGELKKVSDGIIEWFSKRGIRNQTLLRYKVSEGVDYMPQLQAEVKTIHFNYFYNEELVNIKYRDNNKNFKLFSGGMLVPYGINVISDSDNNYVIICEGEIDAMSFYECGLHAVSVPNGASKGSQKLEWLDNCFELFENKRIYLATDMDDAGLSLRNELARRLGKENCYIVEMPCKDANEVLVKHGKDELVKCFKEARQYPIEGVDDASSVSKQLFELYKIGEPVGYNIFYEPEFVWNTGQVNLITGIPGHGKSTFLKNVIYRLAYFHGLKFFIYSAEEANTSYALSDMFKIATGKSFFNSEDRLSEQEMQDLIPFMTEHFKYYNLNDNDLSIDGILAKAKELIKRNGINGIIIDNMSTVEKSMSSQDTQRHHQIKNMMNDIARFARNNDVMIFIVAHPRKISKTDGGKLAVPNGYDVGDSSHWFNLTDNGFTIYRNYETGLTENHRWKVRFGYTGTTGMSCLKFNPKNSRYEYTEQVKEERTNGFSSLPRPI
jgi:twinkle protein